MTPCTTCTTPCLKLIATFALGCALATSLYADTFGSGANIFTIDFASIGNAGNGDDLGAGGGIYSSPYGGVGYTYRMGVTEVPQDWITKATNLGLTDVTAGAWPGSQPAGRMTWFEAAAFVNFLNTITGHHVAYQMGTINGLSISLWSSSQAWQADGENLYRHKDAYYFLPSEDEWYKAAYHKNDGVTANYWDYATGSNSIPDGIDFDGDVTFDAVFFDTFNQGHPNAVTNVGVASPYGTVGQTGNMMEWMESELDAPNDYPDGSRAYRGGTWGNVDFTLNSSNRNGTNPVASLTSYGFRVASIPEPAAVGLILSAGLVGLFPRRRVGHH